MAEVSRVAVLRGIGSVLDIAGSGVRPYRTRATTRRVWHRVSASMRNAADQLATSDSVPLSEVPDSNEEQLRATLLKVHEIQVDKLYQRYKEFEDSDEYPAYYRRRRIGRIDPWLLGHPQPFLHGITFPLYVAARKRYYLRWPYDPDLTGQEKIDEVRYLILQEIRLAAQSGLPHRRYIAYLAELYRTLQLEQAMKTHVLTPANRAAATY